MSVCARTVALLALVLTLAGCRGRLGKPPPPKPSAPHDSGLVGTAEGDKAPEIIGEDIDGKTMRLSDYRGKVVLLDFWKHD